MEAIENPTLLMTRGCGELGERRPSARRAGGYAAYPSPPPRTTVTTSTVYRGVGSPSPRKKGLVPPLKIIGHSGGPGGRRRAIHYAWRRAASTLAPLGEAAAGPHLPCLGRAPHAGAMRNTITHAWLVLTLTATPQLAFTSILKIFFPPRLRVGSRCRR